MANNGNNEFDDNLDKRAGAERANEDVSKALLKDVQVVPDAAAAKESKDANNDWSKSIKDGSYKEKTEELDDVLKNPTQYLEKLKSLDEKTLKDMLEANEAAIKAAKAVVNSIGTKFTELAGKL